MGLNEIAAALNDRAEEEGWEWDLRVETAANRMWGAELRVDPDPTRDGPNRSFVSYAAAGETPDAVAEKVHRDMLEWLEER